MAKEFYHYSYQELTELIGEAGALQRVEQYKALAKQYSTCQGFVIHNCSLLNSYRNTGQQPHNQAS